MFITLKPRIKRQDNATQVVARLRAKTLRIPGIGCFFQAAQDIKVGGRATKGPYIYSLVSTDQNELNTWVPTLMAQLQKDSTLNDLTTDHHQRALQSDVVVDM